MNPNENITNDSAAFEQDALKELAQFVANSAANIANIQVMTPEGVVVAMNYAGTIESQLKNFEPVAQILVNSGRPKLNDRLMELYSDIRNVKQQYQQLYQGAAVNQSIMRNMDNFRNYMNQQESAGIIGQVFNHWESVRDKAFDNWSSYIQQ